MIEWQTIDTAPIDVLILGCEAGNPESMCVVSVVLGADKKTRFVGLSQTGGYAEDDWPSVDITHWTTLPEVKK